MLLLISYVLYFSSIGCAVVGLIMLSRRLREIIVDLYIVLKGTEEDSDAKRSHALSATFFVLCVGYLKNGKVSHVRLALLTLALNATLLAGTKYLQIQNNSITKFPFSGEDIYYLPIAVVLLTIISYPFEYLSVRISLFLYKRAFDRNSLRYMGLDVISVFFIFYICPFIVAALFILFLPLDGYVALMLIVVSPLTIPFLFLGNILSGHAELDPVIVMFLPGVFSPFVPSAVGLLSYFFLSNRSFVGLARSAVEHVSVAGAKNILILSGTLLGFASGIYGFEG